MTFAVEALSSKYNLLYRLTPQGRKDLSGKMHDIANQAQQIDLLISKCDDYINYFANSSVTEDMYDSLMRLSEYVKSWTLISDLQEYKEIVKALDAMISSLEGGIDQSEEVRDNLVREIDEYLHTISTTMATECERARWIAESPLLSYLKFQRPLPPHKVLKQFPPLRRGRIVHN